jgi:hypothetical protein
VITSCCGALFSANAKGVAAEVSSLDPGSSMLALYGTGAAALASGLWCTLKRRGGPLFALAAALAFVTALAAIVSCVALYVYEHPHHHCPFCLLKQGHGYVGYLLYIPLFAATALAFGAGVTSPWRRIPSLSAAVERDARRLAGSATALFALFYLVTIWLVMRSHLVMAGVWW